MTVIVIGDATKTSSAASEVLMRNTITVKPVLLLLLMMMMIIVVTKTKTDVRALTTNRRFRLKLISFPASLPKSVIAAERHRARRRMRCQLRCRIRRMCHIRRRMGFRIRRMCRMRCRILRLSGGVRLFRRRRRTRFERVLSDEKTIAAIRRG